MNLQRVLILAGVIFFGVFIYFAREDIAEAFHLIRSVNWWFLLLIVPLQGLDYTVKALFYRSMLMYFGYRVSVWRLFKLSWAMLFVNVALPSAGLSSLSLMGAVLRNDDVPSGKVTLTHFSRYAITYVSYFLILVFGVLALYFSGDIAKITIRFTVLIGFAIVGLSIFGLYALYDKRAFNWVSHKVQQGIDWFSKKVRSGKELIGGDRLERVLYDFYDGFHQVMRNRAYLRQPFVWGLIGNVIEVLIFYVVFLALGFTLNPGVVIIAYAIANGAGFISIIPGDVGVYEIVMVAVLTAAGVPLSVGVSATLLYRVVVKLVFLPIGFYFYTRHVQEVPHAAHR